MPTKCYTMLRGSMLRITALTPRGQIMSPVRYATSKSVASVRINEMTESGTNEVMRSETEEGRIRFASSDQTIRYTADIEFLRVDPGVFSLVAGVPLVTNPNPLSVGFGEEGFGEGLFGGYEAGDPVVGYDAVTRLPPASFALEVWSRLAGQRCEDGTPQWGYTLFPFLKGGRLSGFEFTNGLVSFSLVGAQSRRAPGWNTGPYDMEGLHQRLIPVMNRTAAFRSILTSYPPPIEGNGIYEFIDAIEGGTASSTTTDILDGEFTSTSDWIVEGGAA